MNGSLVVFVGASGIAIGFALMMVFNRKPVMSVLSLVVTFFGLAVLSILLAAPFIAALQVIVYAGAILVLFLFVIMLLNLNEEATSPEERPIQRILGVICAVALGGILVGATLGAPELPVATSGPGVIPAVDEIPILGRLLFSSYTFAFEALSVLLLLASIGALVLTKRRFD